MLKAIEGVKLVGEGAYWAVEIDDIPVVSQESYAVASRLACFLRYPSRLDHSEIAEVAKSILRDYWGDPS